MSQGYSVADELKKLKELLDDGVLTQEEFDRQKERLMDPNHPSAYAKPMQPIQQPVYPAARPVYSSNSMNGAQLKQQKKVGRLRKAVLILLIFGVFCFGLTSILKARNPAAGADQSGQSSASASMSKSDYLAFDERTWGDFVHLYKAHNSLMKTMGSFSDGQISASDFYTFCKESEEYFAKASMALRYGETTEQNTYLDALEKFAYNDQMIAQKLMDYIDSGSMSDFSAIEGYIDDANTAAGLFASNRGTLLKKAGLSMEEITALVEEDMKDLEEEE